MNTSGGLLGDSVALGGNLVPLVGHSGIEETLQDSENNLEFSIVGGGRVGEGSVLKVVVE